MPTTTTESQRASNPRSRPRPCAVVAAALLLVPASVTISPAATGTALEASYAISLAGVTVGTAEVDSRFTDTEYTATIIGTTSGISRIFSDAQAKLLGNGRISRDGILATSYDLETREGEFETHVRMKMQAGTITDLLVIPRLQAQPDRVAVEPEHRRNVVDPIAALLVVSDRPGNGDGERICRRTIKVFDGWQRYDISLSYKQTRAVEGNGSGFDGRIVACAARYIPVAGHRLSLKSTHFMAENKRLEVWYAPVDGRRLLVPYRILIGTAFGDIVVVAKRFAVSDFDIKPPIAN